MPSITQSAIRAGAANLWFGVSDPGDGNAVTLSSGEPGSGTYLGATDGDLVFTYTPTFQDIASEQLTAAHDAFMELEDATIEAQMTEFSHDNLGAAIEQATQESGTGTPTGDVTFFGGKIQVNFGMVVATAALRDDPTKFLHIGLYRALMTSELSAPFGRASKTVASLTFKGYADQSKTAGKQVGYLKIET